MKMPISGQKQISRLDGLVDTWLTSSSKVALFGAGSGGQEVVRDLAACEVQDFTLIDDDVFAPSNVSTSLFRCDDDGWKVDIARREILAINAKAKVEVIRKRDSELSEDEIREVVCNSNLVLQLTDDVGAALRLNELGIQHNVDVLHAGTHAGNETYELIGTLGKGARCYRCLARERSDLFETGHLLVSESHPSFRLSAGERNAKISYVALGLLHERAGSDLPIARWGAAFLRKPCWIGRLLPAALPSFFGDVPNEVLFGVRAYDGDPLPEGWSCPVCGASARR